METRLVRLASVGVVAALLAVVFAAIPQGSTAGNVGTRDEELILVVGGQDEMKTRNLFPAIANDVWTSDVIFRVYDTVLQSHPTTKELVPYIAKGVDADGDGTFQRDEYGVFARDAVDWQGNDCTADNGCALVVTVYYDFNGVYFHDGAQADVWDLLFTYHAFGMNARFNTDLRVIMDPDFTQNRQMNIEILATDGSDWQDAPPTGADADLRASLKFTMNEPFALFYESTLAGLLLPEHVWEKAGQRGDAPAAVSATDIHGDFGCMIYPPTASGSYTDTTKRGTGIPPGATDLPASCTAEWDYSNGAEKWAVQDADLIGSGPFKFDTWEQGSRAKVVTYSEFFVGDNPKDPSQVFDPFLKTYIKLPEIDGILFKTYRSTTLGVLALKRTEIDFYHWNIPAEFVPELLNEPNIAVEANPEPGFFYMAYNMRRSPFGYGTSPDDDVGYWYRQAVSHLVDKKSIVQNLLQNFGVIGHGVISPANTFWYNDNIVKPAYDPALAASILDAHYGADPAGVCDKNNPSGCRSFPTIGNGFFEILTPQADYDPVRAAAGQMIADAMRSVGINVESKPLAFGEIVARLDARNFDQYILGWRIGGTDPDYLFSFFDRSNAAAGQNYPGFNNATFDQVIGDSRAELDRTARQADIFQAQEILADARPYEVLYYRTNIEGYRQDRFVNWTVSSGTIWNYYSLLGIRPPSTEFLRASVSMPSAVTVGNTATMTITVFDQARAKIDGAKVNVVLTDATQGTLTSGSESGWSVNATSNADGQALVNFQAGALPADAQSGTVLFEITVTHADFPDPAVKTAQITVFPVGATFLAVAFELPNGDVTVGGGTLLLTIEVTDQDGNPVSDAQVAITSQDPAVGASPGSGQAGGLGTVSLVTETVSDDTNVDVNITATKAGYEDGEAAFVVVVLKPTVAPCPAGQVRIEGTCRDPTVSTPGPEALLVLATIGLVGAAAVVLSRRRER